MNVRKVVAGSVLAAGLGVAGLSGAATAFADVTDNPTVNDSTGYGVTNHMKNGFNGDHHGIGWARSQQTGEEISAIVGDAGRDADVNGVVSHQGDPDNPADFGPINDKNPVRVGNGR
jgi:hypothetical protein